MKYDKYWHDKMLRKKKEELVYLLKDALKLEEKRTNLQNRSLHLFFTNIADQLNNLGIDCTIEINGLVFTLPYTGIVFKEQLWKPIQKTLYGIESTTDLTTKKINGILEVLAASFSHTGIQVIFPSKWELIQRESEEIWERKSL